MSSLRPLHRLQRGTLFLAALVLAMIAASLSRWSSRGPVAARAATAPDHLHGPMSQVDMERWVRSWFAAHPARGARSQAAPSDSFTAQNFFFDENGDGSATQIDTARIFEGETVLWKLVSGSHTVTNGTGGTDPNAGILFDQPLNTFGGATSFSFQFNTAGTFPFFCRPHEGFNMKGVVVVRSASAVDPIAGAARPTGFLAPPRPNPTRGTTSFRFALAIPGRARAQVFDVRGRRVATLLDRDLTAGSWEAAWDGRENGAPAAPGVYYIELALPGGTQSRAVVMAR